MIRKITFWLDDEYRSISAALLAAVAVVLSFMASSTPELRYCIPVGLGLGVFAVFTMSYSVIDFPVPYVTAALFGAFGYAYDNTNAGGFGNLHADTAWYALGAFLLAFALIGDIAGWDTADSYYDCVTRTALATSLAVVGFVPLTYGTADRPWLFACAYLAIVGWWTFGERRFGAGRLPWSIYFAMIVFAVLVLGAFYASGNRIAAAIAGLAAVVVASRASKHLEELSREAAQARA